MFEWHSGHVIYLCDHAWTSALGRVAQACEVAGAVGLAAEQGSTPSSATYDNCMHKRAEMHWGMCTRTLWLGGRGPYFVLRWEERLFFSRVSASAPAYAGRQMGHPYAKRAKRPCDHSKLMSCRPTLKSLTPSFGAVSDTSVSGCTPCLLTSPCSTCHPCVCEVERA